MYMEDGGEGGDGLKVAAANTFPLERLNLVSEHDLVSLLIVFLLVIQNLMRKALSIVLWTGRRRISLDQKPILTL